MRQVRMLWLPAKCAQPSSLLPIRVGTFRPSRSFWWHFLVLFQ